MSSRTPKQSQVRLLGPDQEAKVKVVELEGHGKLAVQLVDQVEELQEDGRVGGRALRRGVQRRPVREAVAEGQPVLLHQHAEAVQRPVVRVQAQLNLKRREDRRNLLQLRRI